MAAKTLAIDGSYHRHGIINQAMGFMYDELYGKASQVERINLLDCNIGFCTNCRQCTQPPGVEPGPCPLDDDMQTLIGKIEQADQLILAAPVNFGAVTAIYKRFMERLIPYAYWPFDKPYPAFRKKRADKSAVLVTSTAMPGIMARFTTNAMHSLKFSAKTVGAKPVGKIYIGLASGSRQPTLSDRTRRKLKAATHRLS